jgi:hypothetical protein
VILWFDAHEQLPEFRRCPREREDRDIEHKERLTACAFVEQPEPQRNGQRDDDLSDEAAEKKRFMR